MPINTTSVTAAVSTGADVSVSLSTPVGIDVDLGTYTRVVANDYERLTNLPSIEGVTLTGDHTQEQLGVNAIGNAAILALF
jgi:hypothetical protein